jgi:hypothetical protein
MMVSLVLTLACGSAPASQPPSPSPPERPNTLAYLRRLIQEDTFPLPSPFPCAGFDDVREIEIDGGRRAIVLSCNRDGLLALFRSDGTLVATHETDGKPIVVTAFSYDESGQALDKLLVEEFSWGTGVLMRDAVVYRLAESTITELWREPLWIRAGGPGQQEQYVDGFVRLARGVYQGHGPLLTYGMREAPRGAYRERTLEVATDSVRPFSGTLE